MREAGRKTNNKVCCSHRKSSVSRSFSKALFSHAAIASSNSTSSKSSPPRLFESNCKMRDLIHSDMHSLTFRLCVYSRKMVLYKRNSGSITLHDSSGLTQDTPTIPRPTKSLNTLMGLRTATNVSAHYYECVRIRVLQQMCPHTANNFSAPRCAITKPACW